MTTEVQGGQRLLALTLRNAAVSTDARRFVLIGVTPTAGDFDPAHPLDCPAAMEIASDDTGVEMLTRPEAFRRAAEVNKAAMGDVSGGWTLVFEMTAPLDVPAPVSIDVAGGVGVLTVGTTYGLRLVRPTTAESDAAAAGRTDR